MLSVGRLCILRIPSKECCGGTRQLFSNITVFYVIRQRNLLCLMYRTVSMRNNMPNPFLYITVVSTSFPVPSQNTQRSR
jgi:hypothetical protein